MKTYKVKGTNFVETEYRKSEDAKYLTHWSQEQFMTALGKSKVIPVRDWFGDIENIRFTITNVEIGKYGVIYTIECEGTRYDASVSDICKGMSGVVFPVSYSFIYD